MKIRSQKRTASALLGRLLAGGVLALAITAVCTAQALSEAAGGSGVVDHSCQDGVTCSEDLTGDGLVNVLDLLQVLGNWGTAGGDVTCDGDTNVFDVLAVLAAWGSC